MCRAQTLCNAISPAYLSRGAGMTALISTVTPSAAGVPSRPRSRPGDCSPGDEGEFYCNLEECQSAKVYNEKNNHSAGALNDVEGQPNWVEDSSTDE